MTDEILLRARNLKLYFNKDRIHAVDDISFDIKKGEVFSLVGESSCGKTTTGRSLVNLYRLTGGRIYFHDKLTNAGSDQDLQTDEWTDGLPNERSLVSPSDRSFSVKKFRKNLKFNPKIQMIFQDPVSSLDPRMTIREIIAEGLLIQGVTDRTVVSQKVNEVLLKVGLLPEYADRYPHEFSGGQKQRIGIARAIIMNPELIIADEPVSALDVSIKAQIINLLNDLRKEMGLTVLFVAHDLSIVRYFSDRIAVMYKGKTLELADSEELFTHPLHPYTRALLSAIPLPDPDAEKKRERIIYDPTSHDYSKESPSFTEIKPGHFVMANSAELERYRNEIST